MQGQVFSIERFSIHDGPGVRTSVFFKGCPLHCIWCHNPESHEGGVLLQYLEKECTGCLACTKICPTGAHRFIKGKHEIDRKRCAVCGRCVSACPAEALKLCGKLMDEVEVFRQIQKDKPYYGQDGGLTLSGGEPLLQPDFAKALLERCRAEGISACVETAGCVPWEAFQKVLPYVDLFLYDYKMDSQEEMDIYTGGSFRTVMDNLRRLWACGKKIVLRCPVIPGINDTAKHLEAIARLAQELAIADVEIMPYHSYGTPKWEQAGKEYALPHTRTMTKEEAQSCFNTVEKLRREYALAGRADATGRK